MTKKLTYHNVGEVIVELVPDLSAEYAEAFYKGEPLVHVFFGNVANYVLEQTKVLMDTEELQPQNDERIRAVLDLMEQALSLGSKNLQGAVMASFLEDLDTDDEKLFRRMVSMMGPTLKEAVKNLTEFYHSKEWLSFQQTIHGKKE